MTTTLKDKPESSISLLTTSTSTAADKQVAGWRTEQLTRAGYGEDAAAKLGKRGDLDLHQIVVMRRQGCPDELALSILL